MKNLSIIILLFLFSSCIKENSVLLPLDEETPIIGQDYPNELFMSYPLGIDIIGNDLLIFTHKDQHIIKIVDAQNGSETKNVGLRGDGPNEIVQPFYWGFFDNHIYLYDFGKKKLRKYNWNTTKTEIDFLSVKEISLSEQWDLLAGKIINNQFFVTNISFGLSKPIVILNDQLSLKDNLGEIPDKKPQTKALFSFSGHLSSYENRFVFAMAEVGYIAYYELNPDGTNSLLWDHYLEKPIYKGTGLDRNQLKLAFSDVKMTKNYIFCSYFGEKLSRENMKTLKPRNLLVFDHKGNLIKNFRSKRSLGKFTVSEDEKTIYAVTEEPEVAIIRFDISNLLK